MIKAVFDLKKSTYPVNVDLIFKLLAITVIFRRYLFRDNLKIPFLDWMTEVIKLPQLPLIIAIIILTGIVIIFFSTAPNLGSALIAMCILVTILGCRPCYADSRFYIFSLFLIMALYNKKSGMMFLRLQVIILYFGSGLNKLFDHDWQTGQYLENWLFNQIENPVYIAISPVLPSLVLAKILSWSVIIMELSIALCFTKHKTFRIGIWLGVLLHSGSILAVNQVFGSFIVGSFISYLAFIDWPDRVVLSMTSSNNLNRLIKHKFWIDPYNKFVFRKNIENDRNELSFGDKKYSGFLAVQYFLAYCPISYSAVVGLLIIVPESSLNWLKGVLLILIAFLMLPISARIVDYLILKINVRRKSR